MGKIKNNKNNNIKIAGLRIGDWVNSPRGALKIIEIGYKNNEYYLRFEGLHEGYWLSNCEPIQMTEDWLLRCPIFIKSYNEYGNTYHILKDGCEVRYTIEHWTRTDSQEYRGRFHWVGIGEIKFFHQLQNLYYALIGEELKVRE